MFVDPRGYGGGPIVVPELEQATARARGQIQRPRTLAARLEGLGEGELDVIEWYGNGKWPSATTVHAKANGGEWETHNIGVDNAWHTWRTYWDGKVARFWLDYTDGAQPYFEVTAGQLPDWPFNDPGHTMFIVLNLAVAGSGGEDPSGGSYPADMLVDWVRVW